MLSALEQSAPGFNQHKFKFGPYYITTGSQPGYPNHQNHLGIGLVEGSTWTYVTIIGRVEKKIVTYLIKLLPQSDICQFISPTILPCGVWSQLRI